MFDIDELKLVDDDGAKRLLCDDRLGLVIEVGEVGEVGPNGGTIVLEQSVAVPTTNRPFSFISSLICSRTTFNSMLGSIVIVPTRVATKENNF